MTPSTLIATTTSGGGGGALLVVFLVVALAAGAYTLWMLIDAIRRDESEYRAGSKIIWILVILLAGVVGGLIYQFVGRPKS